MGRTHGRRARDTFPPLARSTSALVLAATVALAACDDQREVTGLEGDPAAGSPEATAVESRVGSQAPFPGWNQVFNHDAAEWIGGDVEGAEGWCGSIELHDRATGPVEPSAGRGYAVAVGGPCNGFWATVFGAEFRSGPFAGGTPLASAWPPSGWVTEMDVHLDPDASFDYYVAISLLDVRGEAPWDYLEDFLPSIRYFEVPVRSDGGSVTVAGEAVGSTGWHTFRHRFGEGPDGELTVEFQLADRRGGVLFTRSVSHTSLFGMPGEAAADFDAENVGSAYVWLHLAEDVELAIDRYRVRPGR